MKVTDQSNSPIQLDAYVKQAQQQRQMKGSGLEQGGRPGPNDKVQLSAEARTVMQAARQAGEQSDVREDKVKQVKMEIEKGTYQVVGNRIATNMLKEGLENDLLLSKIDTRA